MSIVKMSKLRLVGLRDEQDKILDELYLAGIAHIKHASAISGTHIDEEKESLNKLESSMIEISGCISALQNFSKETVANDQITCDFSSFLNVSNKTDEVYSIVKEINKMLDNIRENYNKINGLKKEQFSLIPQEIKSLQPVRIIEKKYSARTNNKMRDILEKLYKELFNDKESIIVENSFENLAFSFNVAGNVLIEFEIDEVQYNALSQQLDLLNFALKTKVQPDGLIRIIYTFNKTEENKIIDIEDRIDELSRINIELGVKIGAFSNKLDLLKMYSDYISYNIEKAKVNSSLIKTERTFALECYVPSEKTKELIQQLEEKFDALIVTQEKIENKEVAPTLTKNNKLIRQAEFVTNMYSTPQQNEVDPNPSVFIFFMIFFGFIMADIGYGILLVVLGYLLASKIKEENGAKRLWNLIGTGGIFAIIWGVLFGSFFGFTHDDLSIIPKAIMPNPQNDTIVLLLFCLLMGVCQIMVGFALRGINAFKRKRYINGVVNGFAWVLFLFGGVMAASGFLLNFFKISMNESLSQFLNAIATPGLYIMLASLVIAVIFAGIGEKGFAKFTKSFSALYGLINLMSDILSYARLFGLMLSGAIIAQQFNMMGIGLMTSPIGYVLGAIVVLVGHAFNVAMGALGAYIHDVRLQYIEYFSKFYNGDGVPFKPFGIELNYVRLSK